MSGLQPERSREAIEVDLDDRGVLTITLARPEAANSRNQAMRRELAEVYTAAGIDDAVRVVVLTGKGDRHFCAGMDLKEAGQPETPVARRERLRSARDIEQLARLPRPTVAAINGYALGGGFEMALACDMRVMATDAKVGLTEVRHGLMPGGGGTQRLPRLIGAAKAAELLYLGKVLDGPAAEQLGLVNAAVPAADLHDRVSTLAGALAEQSPSALRAIKESLLASAELPLSAGIEKELDGLLFLIQEQQAAKD
ncbi:Enoyl-CoA hydratase [Euzebya pacifica]|uniref:enoyl-CoA hydratase n=1 Tax=Euzebya pacifica TaxID=1608957 RepID=A0A346Y322_9ACTN|nr:enoyl-CoA hydratase/isomerase family protein [Euzebya pacifica]AXV08869.1 Enoyl-CoA hydratase [Euzebya pacifica]